MARNQPGDLEISDSMDVCGDEEEDENTTEPLVEVPLNELSADQLNCLDPFRDDPLLENLKPAVLKDYVEECKQLEFNYSEDKVGLDPSKYCECTQCTFKPTLEESVCCKSFDPAVENHFGCINDDDFIQMILNRKMLEISLRNVWSENEKFGVDQSFSNKNMRYSAYRCLYFFLYKTVTKKKNFRRALPSCLVDRVRRMYPEDTSDGYVGFMRGRGMSGRMRGDNEGGFASIVDRGISGDNNISAMDEIMGTDQGAVETSLGASVGSPRSIIGGSGGTEVSDTQMQRQVGSDLDVGNMSGERVGEGGAGNFQLANIGPNILMSRAMQGPRRVKVQEVGGRKDLASTITTTTPA